MQKITKNKIKDLYKLANDKKFRDLSGEFIVEGLKICKDLIKKKYSICYIVISVSFIKNKKNEKILDFLNSSGVLIFEILDKDFIKISSLENSQGILCVAKKKECKDLESVLKQNNPFFVLFDGIQDPGNMGTIIRTLIAFGIKNLFTINNSVDIYNPKVTRSSVGTVLDVNVLELDKIILNKLKKKGFKFLVSSLNETKKKNIKQIKIIGQNTIIFGNEGNGVSKEVIDIADDFFYIPMKNKVESLNVTVSVAITLYEFLRGEK